MKRILTLATSLLLSLPLLSGADFGCWTHAMAIKSFENGAYATGRIEHRSFENSKSSECWFTAWGGGYNFNKWFKADLGYEYWEILHKIHQHKAVLTTTGTVRDNAWTFSLRAKWELAYSPESNPCTNTLRLRMRGQYRFDGPISFTPYVQIENFTSMDGKGWIRNLYYAGCEYGLSKHHSIDLYYMYHEFNSPSALPYTSASCHILGLGYTFFF